MSGMRVGILGFGRFGAALGGLLTAQGRAFRAWDPSFAGEQVGELGAGEVATSAIRAASLVALIEYAELLIVAVPVSIFPAVIRQIRPFLRPDHTVMDVGSVKEHPCTCMDEILGNEIPHVGTHPLFGPLSIARAEPMRTIVCPSPGHPAAARCAHAFFLSIGSEVGLQDPASHDRHMALTHAMAFFIAKGLIDLGLSDDLTWTPPSFAALAASIAAVRSDAGHLFQAIQRENPYATEARTGLIEALTLIDARIAESNNPSPLEGIPSLPPPSGALREVRDHIDELDRELIALLRRRTALSTRAAEVKRHVGAPILDPGREASLMRDRIQWAQEQGLPTDVVQAVFREILAMSRRAQI